MVLTSHTFPDYVEGLPSIGLHSSTSHLMIACVCEKQVIGVLHI
jgi:hypothetical protein